MPKVQVLDDNGEIVSEVTVERIQLLAAATIISVGGRQIRTIDGHQSIGEMLAEANITLRDRENQQSGAERE